MHERSERILASHCSDPVIGNRVSLELCRAAGREQPALASPEQERITAQLADALNTKGLLCKSSPRCVVPAVSRRESQDRASQTPGSPQSFASGGNREENFGTSVLTARAEIISGWGAWEALAIAHRAADCREDSGSEQQAARGLTEITF